MENKPLKFHWSLSHSEFHLEVKDNNPARFFNFDELLGLCLKAEENGIDSVFMDTGCAHPDPLVLTVALGQETQTIKFMVAVRSGLITPAYFVQQINTASAIIGDRIYVNVVGASTPGELKGYGDFKNEKQRNVRAGEFIEICKAFWESEIPFDYQGSYYQVENGEIGTPFHSEKGRPEIYTTEDSASGRGDCLWMFPSESSQITNTIQQVLAFGKETGLVATIMARPTSIEADKAARDYFHHQSGRMTLVGSYQQIAHELLNYNQAGLTQFLITGCPYVEEIEHFGQGVLPRVREMEERKNHKMEAW